MLLEDHVSEVLDGNLALRRWTKGAVDASLLHLRVPEDHFERVAALVARGPHSTPGALCASGARVWWQASGYWGGTEGVHVIVVTGHREGTDEELARARRVG